MTDARLAEIAAQLFPKLHTANAAQEATARELLAEVRHLRRAALAAHPEPIGYVAAYRDMGGGIRVTPWPARSNPNDVRPAPDEWVVALIPVPEGT